MEYLKSAFELITGGDRELLLIIGTTLKMSFFSTLISSVLGLIFGTLIGKSEFRGKDILMKILGTFMGLPPVVAGLVVFMIFRSVGILGRFHLMFTVEIMVIAQVCLITPVTTCLASGVAGEISTDLIQTARGMNISKPKQLLLLLRECSGQYLGIVLAGFGRSIAEVGAVSLVGGNIRFKTRVMTTAILLEANKGNFEKALALGIILLLISFAVNCIAQFIRKKVL